MPFASMLCYCRGTRRDLSDLFFHSLYQRVLAADCELPFLSPAPPAEHPDFLLRLIPRVPAIASTLWYRAESADIDRSDGGDLLMRFEDGTVFLIGDDGGTIALTEAPPAYTRDDLAAYALGPVLTVALHLKGAVLLHASAVDLGGKAIVFAGASGSGKSTTAAILHREGYRVLSDDVTELSGTRALPAVPTLRLWPDMLDALYGSAAAFPDRAPSWDKKLLTVDPGEAREIGAVLFLDGRRAEPELRRIDAREGWQRLIAEAPTARLPGPEMERKIFEATSALADRVPMYAFHPPPAGGATALGAWLEKELWR
jgi:hypothetical protein